MKPFRFYYLNYCLICIDRNNDLVFRECKIIKTINVDSFVIVVFIWYFSKVIIFCVVRMKVKMHGLKNIIISLRKYVPLLLIIIDISKLLKVIIFVVRKEKIVKNMKRNFIFTKNNYNFWIYSFVYLCIRILWYSHTSTLFDGWKMNWCSWNYLWIHESRPSSYYICRFFVATLKLYMPRFNLWTEPQGGAILIMILWCAQELFTTKLVAKFHFDFILFIFFSERKMMLWFSYFYFFYLFVFEFFISF